MSNISNRTKTIPSSKKTKPNGKKPKEPETKTYLLTTCPAVKLEPKTSKNKTALKNSKDQLVRTESLRSVQNAQTTEKTCHNLDECSKLYPNSLLVDLDMLDEIKKKSTIITQEEQRKAAKLRAENKERLKEESEARKAKLRKYSTLYQAKGPKLNQLNDEDAEKSRFMLDRAFELKQDQEDEIKKCNSLILGTKCHVIRCSQIKEKELIQKQKIEEQRKMVELMNEERMLASKKHQRAVEAERLKKRQQAMEIVEQIKENELNRESEDAKKFEEGRHAKENMMEAVRAEVKDYKDKVAKQAQMRKEFLQINANLSAMKKEKEDMEKIETLQRHEYQKQKLEREMAFEEEVKKQKALKDKEISKIQASQRATQDLQAAKDELNELRTHHEVEKEWRRKEREEVLRKLKEDEDLKEARRKQVEDQRASQSVRIQMEKLQFDRIIKANIEDMDKIKQIEKQAKMAIDEHRRNLLKQVNEKEQDKIKERKILFQEGIKYQEEVAVRNRTLRNTMRRKLEQLRAHNFPEDYVQGIARQLKLKCNTDVNV